MKNLATLLLRAGACAGVLTALAGCTVGPNYQRPAVEAPAQYRGAAPEAAPDTRASLGEQPIERVFTDPELRQLIEVALRENEDLMLAANRVLSAEAAAGIVDAAALPRVTANAGASAQRQRFAGRGDPISGGLFQLGVGLSWEVEFWGRLRRAKEASRAAILASEWGRRAVITGLVSQVATRYFQLRALDQQLDIAERTLSSRQESLRLTQVRETGGAGSLVDVRQAEQLVFGANAQIIQLQQEIEQQENALSTLLGRNPGPVARGLTLEAQPRVSGVPTGLPSRVLEHRPDIAQAEQELVRTNAQMGVAKAAYYPDITLTASGGVASAALTTLFSAPALLWSAAASVAQPIFDGGRISSEVRLAELERDAAVIGYRQTIRQAFREVSDALVAYQRGREYRAVQQSLLESAREARRLADLRYQGGATSYLEVLDSDTRLFVAELGLVQAELSELTTFVEIYRALGGGWQA